MPRVCPASLSSCALATSSSRERPSDLHADVARGDERGDLGELLGVGAHDQQLRARPALSGLGLGRRPGDTDDHAALAHCRHERLGRRAADRVEHDVRVADNLGDVFGGIVNVLVGAQPQHVVAVARRAGADHARAGALGELHREVPDAAGGAGDERRLPALQTAAVEQRLPSGQAGDGNRCGLLVAHRRPASWRSPAPARPRARRTRRAGAKPNTSSPSREAVARGLLDRAGDVVAEHRRQAPWPRGRGAASSRSG